MPFELSWRPGGSVGFLINLFGFFELTMVVVRGREYPSKGGSWLTYFGQSVTLCARATRAILNHAPIGEYRQCFFPAECTQCLCGYCQVETQQHIFTNCLRFAHSSLIDTSPSVKDFVDFLKKYSGTFAFSPQE